FVSEEVAGISRWIEKPRPRGKGRASVGAQSPRISFRLKRPDYTRYVNPRRKRTNQGNVRSSTMSIVPGSRRVMSRLGYGEISVHASAGRPSRTRGPCATVARVEPYRRASFERS